MPDWLLSALVSMITSIIVFGVGVWGQQQVLINKIDNLTLTVTNVQRDVREMKGDIYAPNFQQER